MTVAGPRKFVLDTNCFVDGATLISRNAADLSRIAKVFSFDFVAPYPTRPARI